MPSLKRSTAQYTDLHFDDEIISSIKVAKSELKSILCSLRDRTATISYNGQIVTAQPVDFPRLVAEWGISTKVQLAVRNIITSALFSIEEKQTGAALICAGTWLTSSNPAQKISKKRCSHREMTDCLKFFGGSGMSLGAANAVIDSGGLGCRIDYEETQQSVTKIVTYSGREIAGEIDPLFGDRVGRCFDLKGCTVIAVAGAVESVSSLHFALESSIERPVIILAESFLPDVSNTLAETWRQGRGKCLPFIVRKWGTDNFLDLEKLGILCVSQERGDTFSSLKLESNSDINVSTNGTSCTVSNLEEKSVSKITVEISQTLGGLTGLVKDRVKILVGLARQCARSGVIRWKDFSEASQEFLDLYSKDLAISSQSVVTGAKASESLQKVLQELGCVILVSQGAKE